MLKKHSFKWNEEASFSFKALKKALFNALVLSLPNFNKEFIVEYDASGTSLGAVLQQKFHPIAFFK